MTTGCLPLMENLFLKTERSRTVLNRLRERNCYRSFKTFPTFRVTPGDKDNLREMFKRVRWLFCQEETINPLFSIRGLFTHLNGMRDPCFPMGVKVEGVDGIGNDKFLRFTLSSPSYWNHGKPNDWWMEILNDAREITPSWEEGFFHSLEYKVDFVNSWEQSMLKYGFYVLPTGFEAFFPIGEEGGWFCSLYLAGLKPYLTQVRCVYQNFCSPQKTGEVDEVPKIIWEITREFFTLELRTGLPDPLKQTLFGV